MKKNFWFKVGNWNKELVTAAIEAGVEAIVVPHYFIGRVRELGVVKIISTTNEADWRIGKDIVEVLITRKEDEDRVVKIGGRKPVIIRNEDWTIIPLENLISKTTNLIQVVSNAEEAKIALQTLEKGADGVLLETEDANEIRKTARIIQKGTNERLRLVRAKITEVTPLGLGDRVCVDTSSILKPGQGLLVGDAAARMFLVYNENVASPYCESRPFRVNAGGVHSYVLLAGNKTKYLAELKSGERVIVVDQEGNTREVVVGRAKIESRPMVQVKALANGAEITVVTQNAETIRLTDALGRPVSVAKLKVGDEVLAFVSETESRHFGLGIDETIIER